jgi:hypothetical protein
MNDRELVQAMRVLREVFGEVTVIGDRFQAQPGKPCPRHVRFDPHPQCPVCKERTGSEAERRAS